MTSNKIRQAVDSPAIQRFYRSLEEMGYRAVRGEDGSRTYYPETVVSRTQEVLDGLMETLNNRKGNKNG
jgi:hypothetical protein